MKRLALVLPALLALTIVGCAAQAPTVEISAACTTAMENLANDDMTDADRENALIAETATACKTWPEYIAAVKANPQSWLYESADDIDEVREELLPYSVCGQGRDQTPVCLDAAERGLLD